MYMCIHSDLVLCNKPVYRIGFAKTVIKYVLKSTKKRISKY